MSNIVWSIIGLMVIWWLFEGSPSIFTMSAEAAEKSLKEYLNKDKETNEKD